MYVQIVSRFESTTVFLLLYHFIGRERTFCCLAPGDHLTVPRIFKDHLLNLFYRIINCFVLHYCTVLCYPVLGKKRCAFYPNELSLRGILCTGVTELVVSLA